MSTWSPCPMTSLGPHEEGEKQITLCTTLCCDIGKYLRLWWHIRGSDYPHLGGSGKKPGLEGGARVHPKDRVEGHSIPYRQEGKCREVEVTTAKCY